MAPTFDLGGVESAAKTAFWEHYPLLESRFSENRDDHAKRALSALRFLNNEDNQIIQIRSQGFTFNRLTPYTTLDDYLGEIERCWKLFVEIAKPALIKSITLRYINRILLPRNESLSKFLQVSPQLPPQSNLQLSGFLNQYGAVEADTGNFANIVLTAQSSESDHLPLIFDITVSQWGHGEAEDWAWVLSKIMSLRCLKNRIFQNTLTEQCLKLFQTSDS